MTLLPTGNFAKLLLRDPSSKTVQSSKNLCDVLQIQSLALRFADQLFHLHQALAVEMAPKALMHLLHNLGEELLVLVFARVEDLVNESRLQQLLRCDTLAHDERLVGFADAQALHKRMARSAFCHQPERGKGREQERMRRAVDEIGVRDERGGETYDWAVERRDEDLRMGVEGIGDLEVVGYEIAQAPAAHVGVLGEGPADGDVGAGGEVAARACQDGDEDVVAPGHLAHQDREAVVEILG